MAKAKKQEKEELLSDYLMLEKMSKDLALHQKNIRVVGKSIVRKVKSDLRYGFLDNLDIVEEHMKKAQKELDKARKELKQI